MAKRRVACLLGFAALIGAQSAQAQSADPANPTCPLNPNWSTNRQMTFQVVERPGDRPILLAEGVIDADLIPRLRAAINDFQGDEIRLRSPGGNPRIGNEAARLIRQSGLTTRIPAGWACNDACAFMFMGGIVRTVEPGGLFIVQPLLFSGHATGEEIAQAAAEMAAEDIDFLIRMGVSRALASDLLYNPRPPQVARLCLTQAELVRYNVTNGPAR